ncbi:MAG: hypothetical protein Greene101415_237 [Parcubacteria group bacterium Greene1014_15]|nr:MAG: hypothetical protein Greene101415_237 [Parcubacteria group bacterium Greene1014_15]
MEELKKRPQTWAERRKQLRQRHGTIDPGLPPHFITLLENRNENEFWEAKKLTDAPVIISEERYTDIPNTVIVYGLDVERRNLNEFWHVFGHLCSENYHTCDARCEIYELPPYKEKPFI